jgi:glycosyltransferase involved in cell wall biosynthesis
MSVEAAEQKKVLHIVHGFGPGGVETWLLSAVKYLHNNPQLNMQFDFLLTGGEPGIYDDEVKQQGCEIFYVRYSNRSIFRFRKAFRAILKRNKYSAVHDHQDFISGWHFLLAGSQLPDTRISHLHNPYNFVHNYVVTPLRRFSFKAGRRLMAHFTTKITGTSNAVMDEYGYNRGVYKDKRTYPVYCGFDTTKFSFNSNAKQKICNEFNWDSSVRIALFAGRIGLQSYDTAANQKNPQFAFEIAKELVTKHPEWRFLFVGYKGDTGEQMENSLGKNMESLIRFTGIRRDIATIMSACDVFVFPSLWEGLGMVAVEAQCSGLNVMMSDTVPAEAIVCDELVIIKSINEGASAWADSIAAIEAKYDRKKYAEVIRHSHFSIENSVGRLIHLYES